MALARRLDGLPLALATAGMYLNQTADSFSDYLRLYNDSWNDLELYSDGPLDYEDRALYSTWNLSLQQVRSQDPEAAELLRLMAFLDNQDLWFELFQAGAKDRALWWLEVMKSKARFNRAMSKLHDYSLVEIRAGSYSLHACVHDWTLECLNRDLDNEIFQIAVHCVAKSVRWKTEEEYWVMNRRLFPHMHRLEHNRAKGWIDWSGIDMADLHSIGYLCSQLDMKATAEEMYVRALRGYEKEWGPEHTLTLNKAGNLGNLYKDQGKMVEAEEMYMRVLRGYEKTWGPEHMSTLATVNNLGNLYADQGKMAEAEEMHVRALRGYEKAWGPEHTSTLDTVNNLGVLYANQGKMAEAEEMYIRALRGKEKAWGLEHTSTLDTVNNLGVLYADQGKMVEAEEMYIRALRGYEKAMGINHPRTRRITRNLNALRAR
jgi:tetratricopeptide (TPR) repeat protein